MITAHRSVVPSECDGVRVDRYLAEVVGLATRSQIRGRVATLTIDGASGKLSARLRAGQCVHATIRPPDRMTAVAQDIAVEVIAAGDDFIVVHKPCSMVVHPAPGHPDGTLVNALAGLRGALRDRFGADDLRPGIVHRLDKDTSGVMIVALDVANHARLVAQFAERRVTKRYVALVRGVPAFRRGIIDAALGRDSRSRVRFAVHGQLHHHPAPELERLDRATFQFPSRSPTPRGAKPAQTWYHLLWTHGGYSFLLLSPITGRTHQLRVHLSACGYPIVGDRLYPRRGTPGKRPMLHALELTIEPSAGAGHVTYRAEPPPEFASVLAEVRAQV